MTDRVAIRRLPTGVPGLDEILGGGLPEFSFNLIAGAPGAGKTTLAQQIMFALAGSLNFTRAAERCNVTIEHGNILLPKFPTPVAFCSRRSATWRPALATPRRAEVVAAAQAHATSRSHGVLLARVEQRRVGRTGR